jgi:MCP family monocarboxylic acid transporter-like MFS transporter 10
MTHSLGSTENLELTVRRSLSSIRHAGAPSTQEGPSNQSSSNNLTQNNPDSAGNANGFGDTGPGSLVNESALAPVDEGFGAWSFLTAAFFIEAVVWSFPDAFGVFLNAYLQDPKYATQKNASTLFPLIGTLSSGIMYCSGVIIHPLLGRYPQYKRIVMMLGGLCCFASLFGASYVTNVNQLVFLQGVLYAVGGSMLYAPVISYTPEWFVKRRGLANGLIFSGTAVGGIILPIVLTRLLKSYSIARTLQILSIAIGCLIIPFFPFAKGRLPLAQAVGPAPRSDPRNSWIRNISFWLFMGVNTLQGFGYFVPILWLPTFATDLNIGETSASIILALLNGSFIQSYYDT